ncbi:MAG: formylmethanofuran dehydrogenase subunit C [Gammaproteobacteria bacterium]
MSALTFSLKARPDQRVDMSPLVCGKLAGMAPADIGALLLQNGKAKVRVDNLFHISGSDTDNIVIENSFGKLDFIGKEMNGGRLTVEGDAGAYLALGMTGGNVHVTGNAGLFAACEMKKGAITIDGNTGDFLGAALPGNKMGMKGGIVLVKGNAGQRVGDHMRRGTILIEGDAGDYCGSRMTAGTIAVMGKTGNYAGYAMRRGTLLFWQEPKLSASFNDCGTHTLAFLPMLFASFKGMNSKFAESSAAFNRVRRYGGDMAEMGRGEVLVKLS